MQLATDIFNHPHTHAHITCTCTCTWQSLKDWKLGVGVMVLVLIDLSILVSYTIVEGLQGIQVISAVNKEDPSRSEEVLQETGKHY